MRRFAIEDCAPEVGSDSAESADPLSVLESDVKGLMRKLGEANLTLSERERASHDKFRKLLLSNIEIMDAFDRVFQAVHAKQELVTPQMKKWLTNFQTIHRLLRQVLTDQGVTRIENLEGGFDPQWHKVADTVPDADKEEGTVVREDKVGYLWQGVLLRKAEVVVVRHGSEAGSGDSEEA